jgi:hypothetical protein
VEVFLDVIGNQSLDGVKKNKLSSAGIQLLAAMQQPVHQLLAADGKIQDGAVQKMDLMQEQ